MSDELVIALKNALHALLEEQRLAAISERANAVATLKNTAKGIQTLKENGLLTKEYGLTDKQKDAFSSLSRAIYIYGGSVPSEVIKAFREFRESLIEE
jgi:hypothetical protein